MYCLLRTKNTQSQGKDMTPKDKGLEENLIETIQAYINDQTISEISRKMHISRYRINK